MLPDHRPVRRATMCSWRRAATAGMLPVVGVGTLRGWHDEIIAQQVSHALDCARCRTGRSCRWRDGLEDLEDDLIDEINAAVASDGECVACYWEQTTIVERFAAEAHDHRFWRSS